MDKKTLAAIGAAAALSFGAGRLIAPGMPEAKLPPAMASLPKPCVCNIGPRRYFTRDEAKAKDFVCLEPDMHSPPMVGWVAKEGRILCP